MTHTSALMAKSRMQYFYPSLKNHNSIFKGARFKIHYQSVHDLPEDSVTIDHVNRDIHSAESLEKMGIFVTDQPMTSPAHLLPSQPISSSSTSLYTSSMPRLPQKGRIHLRNGMTQSLFGPNQAGGFNDKTEFAFSERFFIKPLKDWYSNTSNKCSR